MIKGSGGRGEQIGVQTTCNVDSGETMTTKINHKRASIVFCRVNRLGWGWGGFVYGHTCFAAMAL